MTHDLCVPREKPWSVYTWPPRLLWGPQLVRCGPATVAPAAPAPRPSLLSQFIVCSSGLVRGSFGRGGGVGTRGEWVGSLEPPQTPQVVPSC